MGLSQFPDQAKIMFPPLSMFQAIKAPGGAAGEFWFGDRTEASKAEVRSRRVRKEIHVVPSLSEGEARATPHVRVWLARRRGYT